MRISITKSFRVPQTCSDALKDQAAQDKTSVSKLLTSLVARYVEGEITLSIPAPEEYDRLVIYTEHGIMSKFQEKAAAEGLSMDKAVALLVRQNIRQISGS